MTPANRATQVGSAIGALPAAYAAANNTLAQHGASDPRTLEAFARVETLGATVHRQSRLLAGKSKGG